MDSPPVPESVVLGDEQLTNAVQGRRLRNGVITLVLMMLLVGSILFAVPGLHGVLHRMAQMPIEAVTGAVVLEVASCFGFVFAFWLVFWRAPFVFAARVAWTEMAFGSAVSFGGAGSLAVGAWLLSTRGVPTSRVVQRSTVLFLLTSAINVIVLAVFGAGLAFGLLPGPSNPLLGDLPAVVGIAVFALFLALPPCVDRLAPTGRRGVLLRGFAGSIRDAAHMLVRPDWRLLGAIAYLACDIAVLGVCFLGLGHPPSLAGLVLAYQVGYLANIIPVPGGIGVLDAGLVGMLVLYGANATTAAAAVIAYHAVALWVPALIGSIAFVRLQRLNPPQATTAE